jgi:hypothetical protein
MLAHDILDVFRPARLCDEYQMTLALKEMLANVDI